LPFLSKLFYKISKLKVKMLTPGAVFTALITFVAFEWAKLPRGFIPSKPFQPNVMKHYSLLEPFIGYEDMKCCEYKP
jgi:hypothetical protein